MRFPRIIVYTLGAFILFLLIAFPFYLKGIILNYWLGVAFVLFFTGLGLYFDYKESPNKKENEEK